MNKKTLKNCLRTATMFMALFQTSITNAHPIPFDTLSGAGAVDLYTFTCPASTVVVKVDIGDLNSNNNFIVATISNANEAISAVDDVQGDFVAGPIPIASMTPTAAGGTTYYLTVTQTQGSNQTYIGNYHCDNAAGADVAGALVQLQDQ
jgi:hypothetical protein